jgi:hypothetical protein
MPVSLEHSHLSNLLLYRDGIRSRSLAGADFGSQSHVTSNSPHWFLIFVLRACIVLTEDC